MIASVGNPLAKAGLKTQKFANLIVTGTAEVVIPKNDVTKRFWGGQRHKIIGKRCDYIPSSVRRYRHGGDNLLRLGFSQGGDRCPHVSASMNSTVNEDYDFVDEIERRPRATADPFARLQPGDSICEEVFKRRQWVSGKGWRSFIDNRAPCDTDSIDVGTRALWQEKLTSNKKVQRLRSEEHTSELQSRQYLVCRLLLEKKKKKKKIQLIRMLKL